MVILLTLRINFQDVQELLENDLVVLELQIVVLIVPLSYVACVPVHLLFIPRDQVDERCRLMVPLW